MNIYKRNILDCTLRDGGYVNNWQFDNKTTKNILRGLIASNIEYIECGYISQTKGKDIDTTYFSSIELINNILDEIIDQPVDSNFCVMLNMGEYDVASLPEFNGKGVKGIRLAFHKKDADKARELAQIIVDKGYDLFVQPMITMAYTDIEIISVIQKFIDLPIHALYIVDSFGTIQPKDFIRLLYLFDHNLPDNIFLGYHAHNNLQLAHSNAIEYFESNIKRNIYIDSSIFGMGRGAGNLNTELIADYLNKNESNVKYNIDPLLEIMDNHLDRLHKTKYWGYSIQHYLSATIDCHPNYATSLLNDKNLTIVEIKKILEMIPVENKRSLNKELLKKIKEEYLYTQKSTPSKIKLPIKDDILVIASGPNAYKNKDEILNIQKQKSLFTIALNHIPSYIDVDYYFFSNQKRYAEFQNLIEPSKLINTSNIKLDETHLNSFTIDFKDLFNPNSNSRNVAILFFKFLNQYNIQNIYIAGLDGYEPGKIKNFSIDVQEGIIDEKRMLEENNYLSEELTKLSKQFSVHFITESIFAKNIPLKICGIIPARYESSRFEGKPLAKINGIPMIKRTYLQAKKVKAFNKLVVATDDDRIYQFCIHENIDVVMTSKNCLTGTDRIAEAAEKLDFDLYINIQGDEPVIAPESIEQIITMFEKYGDEYPVYNLYKVIDKDEDPTSNTMIKVLVNENDELIYMSRLAVPYNKSKEIENFKKQVCVYGFTKSSLKLFRGNNKSQNEKYEDIEILRFLDKGYKVKMQETIYPSIAVDIPEDIQKVENYLSKHS